jgi:DNA gyrase/topoisomerase IV subunit A
MSHPLLAEEIIKDVHKRIMEGDCKITEGVSEEMLEWTVAYLDKDRDVQRERIAALEKELSEAKAEIHSACQALQDEQNECERLEKELAETKARLSDERAYSLKCERRAAALEKELADAKTRPPCTCGSGAHPRRCLSHPQGYDLHVATLNYENAKEELLESERRAERYREALQRIKTYHGITGTHATCRLAADIAEAALADEPSA